MCRDVVVRAIQNVSCDWLLQATRSQGRPQCAYINNFNHLAVFAVRAASQRAVLLKYKGRENYRSILEPRLGAGEESRYRHPIHRPHCR